VIFLKNLNAIISNNLRIIRKEKKLSLDKVANLTGISKSMLGQIEREETNPTISTVWKIANGLKISFTSLIKEEEKSVQVISKENIKPLIESDNKYRLYPIFPFDEKAGFEIYTVELEPGVVLEAEGHGRGAQEYIIVFEGCLTLQIDEEKYELSQGNAIKFNANRPHIYENKSNNLTVVSMTIYYSDKY